MRFLDANDSSLVGNALEVLDLLGSGSRVSADESSRAPGDNSCTGSKFGQMGTKVVKGST